MTDSPKDVEESTWTHFAVPPPPGDVPQFGKGEDVPIDIVPGFTLLQMLGHGAMGIVFKARQAIPERVVALKMILHGVYASERIRLRFRREAEAIARAQHPNITQIYQYGEAEGRPYIAMEFLAGGTLDARLRAQAIPPREAAKLLETLARAVHYAHEQKIIHRDLKPGNVLLAADGTPKVSDFGLAKWLDDDKQLTPTDARLGTISYMAPEQAEGAGSEVGPAADIYGLGAILFQVLTGRAPFLGESPLDTLLQVVRDEPPPPRRLQPNVPADLEAICLKCLEKKPVARYGSAAALADDLARFQRGEPTVARPLRPAARAVRWCRRHPAATTVLTITAAALLSIIGVLAWSNQRLDERRKEIETRLAENDFEHGLALCEKRDAGLGLHYFLRALEVLPPERTDIAEALRFNVAAWREGHHRLRHIIPHGFPVQSLRCFHDSQAFVTSGHDGTIRIIDVGSGQVVRQMKHTAPSWSVGVSPDDGLVVSGSEDGSAKIWKRDTGEEFRSFTHPGHVWKVAFHPSGRWVATSCADGACRLWNVATSKLDHEFRAPNVRFGGFGFSTDGRWLAVTGTERDVYLWDVRQEPPAGPIHVEHASAGPRGEPTEVQSFAFSPDGRLLVTGVSGSLQIWDIEKQERVALRPQPGNLRSLALHPEGGWLVSASEAKTHCVWDLEGKLIAGPIPHESPVYRVRFHPSGKWFVTATIEGDVQVWSSATRQPVGSLLHHSGGVNVVDFTPDGKTLVVALDSGMAYVWSMVFEPPNVLWELPAPTGLNLVRLHPDTDRFVVSANDGTLRMGDATSGRWLPAKYSVGRDRKLSFALFRKSPRVAVHEIVDIVLEQSRRVTIWNHETGQARDLESFPDDLAILLASPDDRHLVVSTSDSLWVEEFDTGRRRGPLALPGNVVGAVFLDPTTLLLGTGAGQVVRVEMGEPSLKMFPLPQFSGAAHLALDDTRTRLITHGPDGYLRRWDLASGRMLPPVIPKVHPPIEYDRRGRLLLTFGDGVRVFDPHTARPIGPVMSDGHTPRSFCVSTKSDAVLAVSDASIRMWRLPAPATEPIAELRRTIERDTGLSLTAEGELRKLDASAWRLRLGSEGER
jgi:WD40 repeat protein/tRNA A-37 threonylcarbamoyl transferase component Bud32